MIRVKMIMENERGCIVGAKTSGKGKGRAKN